ncbi:hypothetical protein [Streptomyces sp. 061-3]|uniref:hypothetical protein n=1 Tax=Streptomyces sp. 061-3 TaxID=2789268 RepID=UPI0039812A7C
MLDTLDQCVQPCPECGTEIRTDPGFVVWCAACDWNMDPGEPEETPGRLERLRRRLARQHGEKLLTEVTAGEPLRPRRDGASVLAYTIALAVHGATAALGVTGMLLVVLGWGSALPLVGAVLPGIAWHLRPRFEQLPDDEPVLHRADAPQLFAEVVGTAGVQAVDIGTRDPQRPLAQRASVRTRVSSGGPTPESACSKVRGSGFFVPRPQDKVS